MTEYGEGPVSRAPERTTAQSPSVPRRDDYSRGFSAGWRDRAEFERRQSATFSDGFDLGYQAGHAHALFAVLRAAEQAQGPVALAIGLVLAGIPAPERVDRG